MINQEWSIQSRAHRCAVTGVEFQDGDYFYTLLFEDGHGLRREDLSESAWKERNENQQQPYSFWRSKYEAPPPPAPEPLAKQTAEDLLRRYMEEDSAQHAAARYLLAVMLERKRILKEVKSKKTADGVLTRIYEHAKTGEVFVIPDPQLRLDQIEQVQNEVGALLDPSQQRAAPAAVPVPPAAPAEAIPAEGAAAPVESEAAPEESGAVSVESEAAPETSEADSEKAPDSPST